MRGSRGFIVVPLALAAALAQETPRPRNAIIFVADGLRHGSVNPTDTPALYRVRTQGVHFANSHAVFPTQTMPNAATIATGHYPGDTGQFANQIFTAYPLFDTGNFGQRIETFAPDAGDPFVLGDINDHFGGNYLREASIVAYARSYGYNTASVGKTGPAAIQDLTELDMSRGALRTPTTIIIEGADPSRAVPLRPDVAALLNAAGVGATPPARNQPRAIAHQQWLADVTTKALLPAFAKSPDPFVLVFWSDDPDLTELSSAESATPVASPGDPAASRAAVRNADRSLGQILGFLDAHPEVRDNTNLFVTSDHGFSTVSRREVDAGGRPTSSYSATLTYVDPSGREEVNTGHLPPGFLAIDLARHLQLPLYDPDVQIEQEGVAQYVRIDPTAAASRRDVRQKPLGSAALIGGTGKVARRTDAQVVVAQTSIYVPTNDRDLIQRIVRFLSTQDYVGGLFVHDRWGEMPGALRMSEVGLVGAATLPKPAIVVSFKNFSRDAKNPHMTGVVVGGVRQHGQNDHASLARANTFNNMAAIGPDFKRRFTVASPVSNADVQPTLAHIMKMKIPTLGKLRGRILTEALAGGPATVRFSRGVTRSRTSEGGLRTVLMSQVADGRIYLDEACFTMADTCR